MNSTMRANVKPEMLRWARERAGLKTDELRRRFPRYPAWERGERPPTRPQLEKFARVARVQVGALFLPTPPNESLPLADFRTIGSKSPKRPSPDLIDTVRLCELRQEWYRDYARAAGEEPLPFIASARPSRSIERAAAQIRETFSFDLAEHTRLPTKEAALRHFVERAEAAGVLVMINSVVGSNTHRKLDPQEFRGFALADDLAPLVFVNGADTKAAQMFTLAHEVAHLWLGRSALSDSSPADIDPEHSVERWCNRVAAELLVPLTTLRGEYRRSGSLDEEINRLARRFKVSTLVILRRIHDAGYLSRRRFQETYRAELKKLKTLQKSGGGNFYWMHIARTGKRFAHALVASTLEGHTLYRDAHRLLGFQKAETFDRLAHNLGLK